MQKSRRNFFKQMLIGSAGMVAGLPSLWRIGFHRLQQPSQSKVYFKSRTGGYLNGSNKKCVTEEFFRDDSFFGIIYRY